MLANVIQSLGLTGSTAEEIVAALSETVVNQTNTARIGFDDITLKFSLEAAETMYSVLNAAGLPATAATFVGKGIDLSLPTAQAQLTALGAANTSIADFCNTLKELGISYTEQWRKSGLAALPTIEEVEAVLAANASRQEVVTFLNSVLNSLIANESTTKSQIKDAVAAW